MHLLSRSKDMLISFSERSLSMTLPKISVISHLELCKFIFVGKKSNGAQDNELNVRSLALLSLWVEDINEYYHLHMHK